MSGDRQEYGTMDADSVDDGGFGQDVDELFVAGSSGSEMDMDDAVVNDYYETSSTVSASQASSSQAGGGGRTAAMPPPARPNMMSMVGSLGGPSPILGKSSRKRSAGADPSNQQPTRGAQGPNAASQANKRNRRSNAETQSNASHRTQMTEISQQMAVNNESLNEQLYARVRSNVLDRAPSMTNEDTLRYHDQFQQKYNELIRAIHIHKKKRPDGTVQELDIRTLLHASNPALDMAVFAGQGLSAMAADAEALRRIKSTVSSQASAEAMYAINIASYVGNLARRINYRSLVNAGVVGVGLDARAGMGGSVPPAINEDDLAAVAHPHQEYSQATFADALNAELREYQELTDKLVNHSTLQPEERKAVHAKCLEVRHTLAEIKMRCGSAARMAYAGSMPSNQIVAETPDEPDLKDRDNRTYNIVKYICGLLKHNGLKRGSNKDKLYAEVISGTTHATRFWRATRDIASMVDLVLSHDELLETDTWKTWSVNKPLFAAKIAEVPETMLDFIKPYRCFFAFRNGWLDISRNKFFAAGSEAQLKYMGDSSALYSYAVNFFDCYYNTDGYSPRTGRFDIETRVPKHDETGWVDWNTAQMPENHWSKEEPVPIVDDTLLNQRMSLFDRQNYYFCMGRAAQPANDGIHLNPFTRGIPGSGKSTVTEFVRAVFPMEYVAVFTPDVERQFGMQSLIHKSEERFTKYLGMVLDMAGKFNLAPSVINSIVSQDYVTAAVKNNDARTAKCDMPMWWVGNIFFMVPKEETGPTARRFWIFDFDYMPKRTMDRAITSDTILAAMGHYMRRISIVSHEFRYLRETSPVLKIKNSNIPWDFASPKVTNARRGYMSGVSVCARFVGDANWVVRDDSGGVISVKVLALLSKFYYQKTMQNTNSLINTPKDGDVVDAVHMLFPGALILEWCSEVSRVEHADLYSSTELRGTQFNEPILPTQKYIRGLKFNPVLKDGKQSMLELAIAFLNANKSDSDLLKTYSDKQQPFNRPPVAPGPLAPQVASRPAPIATRDGARNGKGNRNPANRASIADNLSVSSRDAPFQVDIDDDALIASAENYNHARGDDNASVISGVDMGTWA